MPLNYEIVEARGFPGQWNVEAIDCEQDGQIYVAMFTGPGAHSRAVEYGDWMNSKQREESGTPLSAR